MRWFTEARGDCFRKSDVPKRLDLKILGLAHLRTMTLLQPEDMTEGRTGLVRASGCMKKLRFSPIPLTAKKSNRKNKKKKCK